VLFGRLRSRGSHVACRLVVDSDQQFPQEAGQALPHSAADPATALGRQQAVERLDGSELRRQASSLGDTVQQLHDGFGLLVLEAPSEGNGIVEDKAQHRPSLISSFSGRPLSVWPLLALPRPSAAQRALARSSQARQEPAWRQACPGG